MVFRWPIEIDGLPILKMGGSFHGYVSHNQMVTSPFHQGFSGIVQALKHLEALSCFVWQEGVRYQRNRTFLNIFGFAAVLYSISPAACDQLQGMGRVAKLGTKPDRKNICAWCSQMFGFDQGNTEGSSMVLHHHASPHIPVGCWKGRPLPLRCWSVAVLHHWHASSHQRPGNGFSDVGRVWNLRFIHWMVPKKNSWPLSLGLSESKFNSRLHWMLNWLDLNCQWFLRDHSLSVDFCSRSEPPLKQCFLCIPPLCSMDWFKGQFTGKPHEFHGKIDGFRLRLSQENQFIEYWV